MPPLSHRDDEVIRLAVCQVADVAVRMADVVLVVARPEESDLLIRATGRFGNMDAVPDSAIPRPLAFLNIDVDAAVAGDDTERAWGALARQLLSSIVSTQRGNRSMFVFIVPLQIGVRGNKTVSPDCLYLPVVHILPTDDSDW